MSALNCRYRVRSSPFLPLSLVGMLLMGVPECSPATEAVSPPEPDACSMADPHGGLDAQSPDYSWMDSAEASASAQGESGPITAAVGPIAAAARQPTGALSGRIIFTSGGHGWVANSSSWSLQRPLLLNMNEDYGNIDQLRFFTAYCFNAGATVVPLRPLGNQTNEVVLDNDDSGVMFSGGWSNSGSSLFYGSTGDVPYRFANLSSTETATATYAPTVPAGGFYPVYTWVSHGNNRTSQLYRILHTGGETQIRVPHHMVGNGWVYLGTYYFNAGSNPSAGAVIISNLQPSPTVGTVAIADAIRFGNGMGDFNRGFGTSTYPSEEECSRYWVQRGLGEGQSPTLYDPDYPGASTDDSSDNVGTPPRMAREMNHTGVESSIFKRLYIGFHSNASSGSARGVVGLWNDNALFPGTGTPNQFRLAQLLGLEVNNDMVGIGAPPLEHAWNNRGTSVTYRSPSFGYGEIRDDTLGGEMDATIVEVAFHDNAQDAELLRDPKVRNWAARATYHGIIRYMNEFDGVSLDFLPEPPQNPRALASGNNIVVSWSPPVPQAGSGAPTGYVIYQSSDGRGFANPVTVSSATNSYTFTNLTANITHYFRLAATNPGGESFPTETVACRISSNPYASRVLLVNAFDRFDRFLNLGQTPFPQSYTPPTGIGSIDRVLPARNNSFDYVVAYADALAASGNSFDSCQNEAVASVLVPLGGYPIVMWCCGNESTADETFSALEQVRFTVYLENGGSLFVSGAEVAWDLDRPSGPSSTDRNFIHNQLHAAYLSDDANSYTVAPQSSGVFGGRSSALFDDGSKGIYRVGYPDVLTPYGAGAAAALNYAGVTGGAAGVQYDGSAGGGRVVFLGFPFETIADLERRQEYMADVVSFLAPLPLAFESIVPLHDGNVEMVLSGESGVYAIERSATLTNWDFLASVTNLTGTVTFTDTGATNAELRFYRAVTP